ncbi:MAG: HAD family hydrolase [bacterium]
MLIIFDCDGVLRSVSWAAMYEAYLAISNHIKRDPSEFWQSDGDFRKWHNNDWHYNLERMGIPQGSNYSVINRIFHDIYDLYIVKFSWVEEVLEHLTQKRHILAVLSGAKVHSVFDSLAASVNYFATIKGADHVQRIKPDPEGLYVIMNELSIGAIDTIMIGDSHADIVAGKLAGVKTVGVTWGMADFQEMQRLQPDYIFDDPMSLKLL